MLHYTSTNYLFFPDKPKSIDGLQGTNHPHLLCTARWNCPGVLPDQVDGIVSGKGSCQADKGMGVLLLTFIEPMQWPLLPIACRASQPSPFAPMRSTADQGMRFPCLHLGPPLC